VSSTSLPQSRQHTLALPGASVSSSKKPRLDSTPSSSNAPAFLPAFSTPSQPIDTSALFCTLVNIFPSTSSSRLALFLSFIVNAGFPTPSDLACVVHLDHDLLEWTTQNVKGKKGWTEAQERAVRDMIVGLKEDRDGLAGEA
jgi:hypothetical protein